MSRPRIHTPILRRNAWLVRFWHPVLDKQVIRGLDTGDRHVAGRIIQDVEALCNWERSSPMSLAEWNRGIRADALTLRVIDLRAMRAYYGQDSDTFRYARGKKDADWCASVAIDLNCRED